MTAQLSGKWGPAIAMCQCGGRQAELVAGPREGTWKAPSGLSWQAPGARGPEPEGNNHLRAWKGLGGPARSVRELTAPTSFLSRGRRAICLLDTTLKVSNTTPHFFSPTQP